MARKRTTEIQDAFAEAHSAPAAVATAPSSPLDLILQANRRKGAGLPTWTTAELRQRTYGIEPYSLALQYLFAGNIIPMPAIIQLAGPPKTYKTSAALEFLGMVLPPRSGFPEATPTYTGGRAVFCGTEGKLSTTKIQSMLREVADLVELKMSDTTDKWQTELSDLLTRMNEYQQKVIEAERSGGRKLSDYYKAYLPPLALVIDSLTGAQSQEMVDKMSDEGSVGRSFQERAIRNTNWFSTWSSGMGTLPVYLLVTNHEKDPVNDQGRSFEKRTPGGVATNYYTTYDIRVSKIKELKTAKHEGALLQWKMHHNSNGIDKRKIVIPYIETYDEQDNQVAYFNWEEATTDLLISLKDDPQMRARLDEMLCVTEHDGSPKTYSCPQLGISKEDARGNKITATDFGRILHSNEQFRSLFRKVLRITEYRTWTPGADITRAAPDLQVTPA